MLLPASSFEKWSVVACDQYTSEPEYWESVEEIVEGSPSTFRAVLPEIYLNGDISAHISTINKAMQSYLSDGVLCEAPAGFILVERTQSDGKNRLGLVGLIDLEQYDYDKSSRSPVRATEGTVLSRIPPRVEIRKDAPLEFPHIMVLIDDPGRTVIEPVFARKSEFETLYDFDLMQGGGHITGRLVDANGQAEIIGAVEALGELSAFEAKYGVSSKAPLVFAVGDGNHSLATAKTCWENLKPSLGAEDLESHPARFALIELVNLHDEALGFEPIHRVVFGVDSEKFLAYLKEHCNNGDGQSFEYVCKSGSGTLTLANPTSNLAVGSLQALIDSYVADNGGEVDYIHGDEVTRELGSAGGNIGFLLPPMAKDELFKTVILDGVLPRKTFSMGHAADKRFYLEGRKIVK